ncbi:MAG: acyl-CoA carboxylase subunit epsilon [Actinomycetes bacterium]
MSAANEAVAGEAPLIRVVRGQPTDEELAALITVLTALGRGSGGESPDSSSPASSGWSAYWRSLRAPLAPGPRAWGMSGRP